MYLFILFLFLFYFCLGGILTGLSCKEIFKQIGYHVEASHACRFFITHRWWLSYILIVPKDQDRPYEAAICSFSFNQRRNESEFTEVE